MWYCQIGFNSATKMLCTKIIIYNQFPVDTSGNWCKIVITNMFYLTSKIFHLSPVVNLVLKFQNGFGDPKPQSIWFFWQISIKTKILAPESARGVEHFKCCVILGHPKESGIFELFKPLVAVEKQITLMKFLWAKAWKNASKYCCKKGRPWMQQ